LYLYLYLYFWAICLQQRALSGNISLRRIIQNLSSIFDKKTKQK